MAAPNNTAFVLGLPLDRSPGERFEYSNEGVQLLEPILRRAAGMPVAAYARERLFTPLGVGQSRMGLDEYGHTITYGAAEMTARDFARLGQLVLNEGRWNGAPVVPAAWIAALAEPVPQSPYYSYLWWVDTDRGAVMARGSFDNNLWVYPDLDLVVVRLQRLATPAPPDAPGPLEVVALHRRIVTGSADAP